MTRCQEQFSGTMDVRTRHPFDLTALERQITEHTKGIVPPRNIRQFRGGQSNPTYLLTDNRGKRLALRRKTPDVLLKSAHAIDREYQVITALSDHTDVPVAHSHALCTDEAIIGAWFYITDYVDRRIFWDAAIPDITGKERAALFDAMNNTLARLHRVDPAAIDLGDDGKPGNYFARQIGRWSKHYEIDTDAGRFPAMDRLIQWLPDNIPPGDEVAIVHGDYRIDNPVFHPTQPRILAILDWDLSTLGHPLADFAYHLMIYHMPPQGFTGLLGVDLAALHIPDKHAYMQHYCRRTERTLIPPRDLDCYIAFNMFRLAAILHGIKGRVKRGTATSSDARAQGDICGPPVDPAWSQVNENQRKNRL